MEDETAWKTTRYTIKETDWHTKSQIRYRKKKEKAMEYKKQLLKELGYLDGNERRYKDE
tara:strand:- start:1519 stop:1695 length:177 start_codon:yes stop_codon:yes gene_type:complete